MYLACLGSQVLGLGLGGLVLALALDVKSLALKVLAFTACLSFLRTIRFFLAHPVIANGRHSLYLAEILPRNGTYFYDCGTVKMFFFVDKPNKWTHYIKAKHFM